MDDKFNMNHVMALKELIMGDEVDDEEQLFRESQKGSVLNPGTLKGDKDKETTKPFSKIEVKPGEKPPQLTGEQQAEQLRQKDKDSISKQQQKQQKEQNSKNAIWKEEEVNELPIQRNDKREQPEYDVMYKQRVGAEDVFLGMSNMDPTSSKCQDLLIKIYLPGCKFKDIQLDVTRDAMVIQSSQYYLHHIFQYPVNDKEGNAKWVSDKSTLQLTLPIIRDPLSQLL